METRKFAAAEKKKSGKYNCAQAVICTYCDKTGIDEQTAMNIGNAFAAGMGNTEGTCGALVGAGVVLGLINKDRIESMRNMRQMMNKFKERNGTTQCKVLKGLESGKVLRECPDCVADACEFLEDMTNAADK
ncbi:MAG: C_GCAxxG_C_C family protein [Alphaproteobacteria bacterium]|nr:C_GCAxxG_C_C family protein [Alphaproteobacteria bacterium]